MDLISIILPAYNSEDYIEQTINSVLNQTYKNFELIIVNDGSTDNTRTICEKLSKEDSRIILYNKENEGVAKARNYGIEKANGKYLMFIDSDDIYKQDIIEKMFNVLIKENVDVVRAGYEYLNEGYINENVDEGKYDKEEIRRELVNKILKEDVKCYLWVLLLKKELAVKFNEKLFIYEDANFYLQVFFKANSVYILKEGLYYYNSQNEKSLTKRNIEKNIDNMILAEQNFRKTLKNYDYEQGIEIIDSRIIANIVNYIYIIQFNESYKTAMQKFKEVCKEEHFKTILKNYKSIYVSKKEKILNYSLINNINILFYLLCLIKNLKNRKKKKF